MQKRLSFIALLSLFSLNFAASSLFAVTVSSGVAPLPEISAENVQEEVIPGSQTDSGNQISLNNNNNQIDDEEHNQIDLQNEYQFTEEEKKAFIEFNSTTNRNRILGLLKNECTTELVEGRLHRYTPQEKQESLLRSLEDIILSGIEVKLTFSKANKLDNGVVEATYNITIGKNLLKDIILIDVTYHYPTFSTKKCVFYSSTDYFLANGCEHGHYVYSLRNSNDKNTIELLYSNNVNFEFRVNTDCPYGVYEFKHHNKDKTYFVKGQLFVDNEKSCIMHVKAVKK